MKIDSIIQRIDAVLDGPVCIRPGCCAPALPWLSPWCTPDCQRTHWAATRVDIATHGVDTVAAEPAETVRARIAELGQCGVSVEQVGTALRVHRDCLPVIEEFRGLEWHTAAADTHVREIQGAELSGAWVDEVDWSRFTADASHSPIEDLNALAGEVIYTTSTPDPPGSWFRSLLARWHGR